MTCAIQGIIPPLVTPLIAPDVLDQPGLERLVASQLSAGVHGLFVLGTTGEGPGLSESARRCMIRETLRLAGAAVPVYVGITDTSLGNAIGLAEYAADLGAAAAVAAPPFYFPAGQTELCHWFTELARAIPLPLVLYNMPGCTKISIAPDTLETLIPMENIAGLKDSSGDLEYLRTAIVLAGRLRPDWPVLIGPEAQLQRAMELGAVGGVTGGANLCPRLFTDLYASILRHDTLRTQPLQQIVDDLQQLYRFGKYESSYLKGLKCALELTGICSGRLAAPYDVFLNPEQQQVLAWLRTFSGADYLPKSFAAGTHT